MKKLSLAIFVLGIIFTCVRIVIFNTKADIISPAVLAQTTINLPTDEEADWSGVSLTPPITCQSTDALDVLVDKFHPLPQDYVPSDLVKIGNFQMRKEAADAFIKMQEINNSFHIISAYRSFADQQKLFTPEKKLTAAPPGFSEHQLGTTVDLVMQDWDWLDQNAHKFGFVMSYRSNQTTTTGYRFEPWHWRYVGIELATQIRNSPNPPQTFYKPAGCK